MQFKFLLYILNVLHLFYISFQFQFILISIITKFKHDLRQHFFMII